MPVQLLAGILSLVISFTVIAASKLPAPPKSRITLMGEEMVLNGIPMQIRHFETPLSEEIVLEFYRRHWPREENGGPGFVESDLKPWKIITRAEGRNLMTVQVMSNPDGGASGYLASSYLPDPERLPVLGEDFPKLKGSTVMRDIQSKDIGKKGRTLQIANTFSVQQNASYYKDYYINRGWTVEMDQEIAGYQNYNLQFSKRGNHVSLAIGGNRAGQTIVVAQIIDEGLL